MGPRARNLNPFLSGNVAKSVSLIMTTLSRIDTKIGTGLNWLRPRRWSIRGSGRLTAVWARLNLRTTLDLHAYNTGRCYHKFF